MSPACEAGLTSASVTTSQQQQQHLEEDTPPMSPTEFFGLQLIHCDEAAEGKEFNLTNFDNMTSHWTETQPTGESVDARGESINMMRNTKIKRYWGKSG